VFSAWVARWVQGQNPSTFFSGVRLLELIAGEWDGEEGKVGQAPGKHFRGPKQHKNLRRIEDTHEFLDMPSLFLGPIILERSPETLSKKWGKTKN
jgi:hypothetical protein